MAGYDDPADLINFIGQQRLADQASRDSRSAPRITAAR
jgi:hypothetical protein